jgi:hypothetical protein
LKPLRLNKVLGLSVGERSLFAAEVVSGDRPEVKRLAEFVYPDGMSPLEPAALGALLGEFLRDQKFTARSAVVGLPARWLVVKPKEVPPADSATLTDLLRIQAEGEFSSELKDLVYDYTADLTGGQPKSVLLLATGRKYIDAVTAMCEAANLTAVIVTPSAVALGAATGRSTGAKNPLVLAISPAGAELTAQSGGVANDIRHLRGPGADRPFVGELRRAISGMPPASTNGTARELVLWSAAGDGGFDSASLGTTLGMPVRAGDLPILGVATSDEAANGDGRKYAAAVSLALLGMTEDRQAVDFLHSRLAPLAKRKIPRWLLPTSLGAIVLISLLILAYTTLDKNQKQLDKLNAKLSSLTDEQKQAQTFVTTVSFAQAWHLGSPRYVMCLRDLTAAIPQDGQTYAISLNLQEKAPPTQNQSGPAPSKQAPVIRNLTGRLDCKTTDQQHIQDVLDRLKSMPTVFTDVENVGSQSTGKTRELSFSIAFTYIPPK